MKKISLIAALALNAAPAFAAGDVAAGEEQFNRQCVACHVIANGAGEVLAGRNAKTGPNLFGLEGRKIGGYPNFPYGDAIVAMGEKDGGTVWSEAAFVAYVQDPTGWLREQLQDRRARGKMAYQVRDAGTAADIYAYISSLGN